ncbi:peptidyl-prolyl cis-trans isomerase, cyclophilin-type protein [Rhizoctonia solani]|uniref:Peptidyl-prolyl cis-trans isomerase H n=1 Tax=Rhizoctonia solani TaxID=456999 RepID=A0A8H8NZM2_9AGAM|nr:peptidyl-prolyl cis-trans isomerase, cyclophilin-type protein [Rhizoctonia solani]QRW21843.1 peptidyl-prolyl cis-trans isomerase, cyclophilin-type protein [Rhizoctonia solani]
MSNPSRPIVFMDINIGETPAGRLKMELFNDIVPKTAENFRQLCTGEHRINSRPQGYKGATFHRWVCYAVRDFMVQGGDFLNGDGTGSFSIYGDKFPDENFQMKHTGPGLLSMANSGPNTNGCQFFITAAACDFLDGKHVVFGKVIDGILTLRKIENVATGPNNRPKLTVKITGLGFLTGLVASQLALVAAQNPKYTIAQDFSGSKFFDGWSFTNGNDAKNYGNVAYLAKDVAMAQQLVYLNAAGNAIIKVDNTTVGSPQDPAYGRASVKMNTTEPFTKGSLVVMDALHFPYGCSVWPAYWSQGSPENEWPRFGEIDIVENVNLAPVNQMSLHTSQGCTLASDTQVTGRIVSNDCYNNTNGNQGCIIQMPDNSFGESFARNGGGVYAVEWSSTGNGIRAWFFPRSSIPADLTSANPNPSTWGTPTAAWPESGCDTSKFFGPQTLIINISICGAYAGATSVFESTCPNQGSCLDLVRNPRNYDNAYFEIAYVRIYSEYAFSFNVLDNSSSVWNNSSGTSSTITSTSQSGSATKTQSGANATGTTGSTNGAIYHSAGFIPAALSLIAGAWISA